MAILSEQSALIIIGITGDLSKRKLLPSLYNLEKANKLPENFKIIGTSRRDVDTEKLFEKLHEHITLTSDVYSEATFTKLKKRIIIIQADVSSHEGAHSLSAQLDGLLGKVCSMKLFYFAIPPSSLQPVIHNLVEAGVHSCGGNMASRLLIEKPFGRDLASAEDLSDTISKNFGSESIYLIDHYLAKETVQNILYMRFHNPLLQGIWNQRHVESIAVTAYEKLDIQGRGDFYEQTGALRDMLQSHLIQLLALVTMNEPVDMNAATIRDNRLHVLRHLQLATEPSITATRAQYKGYKIEVKNNTSSTETYASVNLLIDNDRWRNVPVTLSAGKAMNQKSTKIEVIFQSHEAHDEKNIFTFQIQPNEAISLTLAVKKPGLATETKTISLDYCYDEDAENPGFNDGYDRIIYDAINGDQTLFPSDAEIKNNWALLQPVLDEWQRSSSGLLTYEKGTNDIMEDK